MFNLKENKIKRNKIKMENKINTDLAVLLSHDTYTLRLYLDYLSTFVLIYTTIIQEVGSLTPFYVLFIYRLFCHG